MHALSCIENEYDDSFCLAGTVNTTGIATNVLGEPVKPDELASNVTRWFTRPFGLAYESFLRLRDIDLSSVNPRVGFQGASVTFRMADTPETAQDGEELGGLDVKFRIPPRRTWKQTVTVVSEKKGTISIPDSDDVIDHGSDCGSTELLFFEIQHKLLTNPRSLKPKQQLELG